ncbi:MAG: pyridoxal phosphate-dependent aminotransferase [Deltaproteobacteria bacterium]|nr:pyridoxal phosphate-dependent aminotransferase [Deltaproteobacteria bacterium]
MKELRTSSRLARVAPSITMAVTAKAKRMRAEGIDVISFGAGEPDFDTPEHIKDAARAGLDQGVAKYTHVQGLVELRRAIAAEIEKAHGLSFSTDEIIVSTGAKQSLFNIFQALLDDGDEVVIPSPYWVSYPDMVKLAGGNPTIVTTTPDSGFTMTGKQLDAAITDKTRAMVLNTPSNPTGAVYTRDQLEELAEVAVARDILIISDDIYRSLVYGEASYTSIATLSKEAAERTIVVDGVSKTYAMTGWRIGWTAGHETLIKAMAKIQGQSTSGACHIAQVAATAALTGSQDCVAEMRKSFDARRKAIVVGLNAIDGVSCRTPEGAFYAFPDVSAFNGAKTAGGETISDDVALAGYLLDAAKVAVVPGAGFGSPGFVRMSYACSMDDIKSGVGRMSEALGALSR